jgi:uncharacterized protein YjbJ (UPF0337 family)
MWLQLMVDIRHRWGNVAIDETDRAHGDAERFIWKLQQRYGYARDPGLDESVTSVKITSAPKRRKARIPTVPIDLMKNPEFEDRLR